MAQLKYDKAKRMLWVKDGNESFPIFTLANLNGKNTRLTAEGFLEVKNSNTNSWETITDSDGEPVSLMGAPGKKGDKGDKGNPGDDGSLLMHGGEVVQNYSQGQYFFSTEIVHNLPAGKYIVSANMESSLPGLIDPFGYSSIIVREGNNVKGIYDLHNNNGRVEIELSSPASLYISALIADYLEWYYSQYTDLTIPDFGESIPLDAVFTFKNIWVLPSHECDLGELEQSVESLGETKQDKTDTNLNTTAKTIVGAINEVRSQVTIHGGEVVQNYLQGDSPKFSTIVEGLPAGTYTVSCQLTTSDGQPATSSGIYGKPLVVVYNSNEEPIARYQIDSDSETVVINEEATLRLCPILRQGINIEDGKISYNKSEIIDSDIQYTFKNIWVLPKSESEAIQQLQTAVNNKQDKEDPFLQTKDKTIVGAINELYFQHSTTVSFVDMSASMMTGDVYPHIQHLTWVNPGTYKLEGTAQLTPEGAADAFAGCAIFASTNGSLIGVPSPSDIQGGVNLFKLNEPFTVTSDVHLYIIFAVYDYLTSNPTEWDDTPALFDLTITLSDIALYQVEEVATYSLRSPSVSYTQLPLDTAVLIPQGQYYKSPSILVKTISDLSWNTVSENISHDLYDLIYTEIVGDEGRQLDICGKSYIQITVSEDSISPQLPTLQELYDRQSVFYNYMKENTTAFITVSDVDFIAEEDTWVPKS